MVRPRDGSLEHFEPRWRRPGLSQPLCRPPTPPRDDVTGGKTHFALDVAHDKQSEGLLEPLLTELFSPKSIVSGSRIVVLPAAVCLTSHCQAIPLVVGAELLAVQAQADVAHGLWDALEHQLTPSE